MTPMMTPSANVSKSTSKCFHQGALVVSSIVLLTSVLGCSGKKDPQPLPPQTTTQVTSRLEPPPLPPPIREVRPTRSSTVKVIDPGGEEEEDKPKTLFEASQRAKEEEQRRPAAAAIEINDENLHEYAEKAEIIMLEGEPAAPPPSRIIAPPVTDDGEEIRDEAYWRNRALEIRMGWRTALDRIDELELESAALRQQFYAEEDPYLRDSQIKPAWDRVLDRLTQLRERADRYERELETFLEEGRQSGAEPGWLAEGWELEPEGNREPEEESELTIHRSTDIPVTDEVEDP